MILNDVFPLSRILWRSVLHNTTFWAIQSAWHGARSATCWSMCLGFTPTPRIFVTMAIFFRQLWLKNQFFLLGGWYLITYDNIFNWFEFVIWWYLMIFFCPGGSLVLFLRLCSCWRRNVSMKPFDWPTAWATASKDSATSCASSASADRWCHSNMYGLI